MREDSTVAVRPNLPLRVKSRRVASRSTCPLSAISGNRAGVSSSGWQCWGWKAPIRPHSCNLPFGWPSFQGSFGSWPREPDGGHAAGTPVEHCCCDPIVADRVRVCALRGFGCKGRRSVGPMPRRGRTRSPLLADRSLARCALACRLHGGEAGGRRACPDCA